MSAGTGALPALTHHQAAPARWAPRAIVVLALLPLVALARDAWTGGLGLDPAETVSRHTGFWALRLLLLSLALGSLARASGRSALSRLARPLGLCAFLYASLHLSAYAGLQENLSPTGALRQLIARPDLQLGLAAFLLLLATAAGSMDGVRGRLPRLRVGGLASAAAIVALLHFLWLAPRDAYEPLLAAAAVLALAAGRGQPQ